MCFKFSLLTFLVMIFISYGCGDLGKKEIVKRDLDGSQFEVNCELNMDEFSKIMEKNIHSQISCLEENLNLFIKVVKSEKPGYLSRVQLEQYLAKFRPEVKPDVVRGLKSVFDIGHLITGEDPDFISQKTIDGVINFAKVFNQEAALNFVPIFKNKSPATFVLHQNHRERVSRGNKAIIQALREIFNPNRGQRVHKLNIISLLESFASERNRESIETAKKVLFLKKVLVGGENEVITHIELEKLILNFDQLILITLDIIRYKYIILKQESLLEILRRGTSTLFEIVNQGELGRRDFEILFTLDQVIEAIKVFVDKDKFDVEKFRTLIGEFKKIVMKGTPEEIRGRELNNLFDHANKLLRTGTVFHRIYDKFRTQLESSRPVNDTINFDEYRHTYPDHQAELAQFERIVKNYRFMKGEFLSAYYLSGYKRNADAIFEIAALEYAIKLIFQTYGSPSPNADAVGGYSFNQQQMRDLILKFENELVELDLIFPGNGISTADNISLLGSLFQFQSDKNKVMDVNEASEFGVSVFSAINIASDIFDYMKDSGCSLDEFNRVEPACFRENFWRGFCTNYKTYFPALFESLNTPKRCQDFRNKTDSIVYLEKAILAARTCTFYPDGDKEEIPYSKGDMMTILLGLMHAETTVLRWDVNNNNIMDPDEVDRAYEIYSPALDGFLEDKSPLIKKLKKQIFQYLIKYEQIPNEKEFGSLWKFVKFLASFKKKTPATRKTILSVLYVISEENMKNPDVPKFDCSLLRDPDNIPR